MVYFQKKFLLRRLNLITEVFWLYKETFFLLFVAGAFLPLLGVHLMGRERILESYGLTQGAVLGHLLGQFLLLYTESLVFTQVYFLTGLLSIVLCYFFFRAVSGLFYRQKPVFYFTSGLIFMAATYALSSFYPSLESRMVRGYMGDLVTASIGEVYITSAVIIFSFIIFIIFFSKWRQETLNFALFGKALPQERQSLLIFDAVTLMTLSFSIITLGHLYTLGALIILPLILNSLNIPFRIYLFLCLFFSILSSLGGMSMSIIWSRVSTVPIILIQMVIWGMICLGVVFLLKILKKKSK